MTTTTPDNIRTPNISDPYNLIPDLETLANSVQTALNKRAYGYVEGTLSTVSGSTLIGAAPILRKDSNTGITDLQFAASRTAWTTAGVTALAVLPLGFRPNVAVNCAAAMAGAGNPVAVFIQITTDGTISLHNSPTNGQNWGVTLNITFRTI